MILRIQGFFQEDVDDDSLQFELDIDPRFNQAIVDLMEWSGLEESAEGETQLSEAQSTQIEALLQQPIPHELVLFIGGRA